MGDGYAVLQDEIQAFLSAPGGGFEELALRIFRFQFAENRPYRAYCESVAVDPCSVERWTQIPPAPGEAFKMSAPLSCHPPEECGAVFLTSGTTGEVRGRHYLVDVSLYRASVLRGWKELGLPSAVPTYFLSPPPSVVPDSSLIRMFEFLASPRVDDPWLVEVGGCFDLGALDEAITAGHPLVLFSTALALRRLFQQVPGRLPLPPGSWVFQTGGYKGLADAYSPGELYEVIAAHLEVPPDRVINEYGMTELSTPSYAVGIDAPHRCPPWLKVRTVDPETNQPNPSGRSGHLVFCDLANLNSVVAVRTGDLGVAHDDHTFTLTGRDPSLSPRGCSRASDAFLQESP